MQHEALVGQASKAVNHLLGVLGAERRGADRLRFATREQRRTMRARQEADDRLNRANLLRIAPIDALTILQNGGADDFGLQLLDLLDGDHLHLRIFAGECFLRSEEHTSELQSLMRISYAVFCLKKKKSRIILP